MPSFLFFIILVVEFLPAVIAATRRNRRFGRVFVLCIFSATIICWFLALREALAPARPIVRRAAAPARPRRASSRRPFPLPPEFYQSAGASRDQAVAMSQLFG